MCEASCNLGMVSQQGLLGRHDLLGAPPMSSVVIITISLLGIWLQAKSSHVVCTGSLRRPRMVMRWTSCPCTMRRPLLSWHPLGPPHHSRTLPPTWLTKCEHTNVARRTFGTCSHALLFKIHGRRRGGSCWWHSHPSHPCMPNAGGKLRKHFIVWKNSCVQLLSRPGKIVIA